MTPRHLALLPFLLALPAAALAQDRDRDWARCRGDSPEVVIAGCTALIASAHLSDAERDQALSARAFAYRFQHDYPHAIADYQDALRRNPRAIWTHIGLGNSYRDADDSGQASGEYARALGLAKGELGNAGPQSAQYAPRLARVAAIHYERGRMYEGAHDYPHATEDFREALRRAPNDPEMGNALCWTLAIRSESLDEARAACDASLRARPNHAPTLDSRGMVGLKQGRFQDAWNDYDAAVRIDAGGPSWVYGRGIAALRLGRTAEGRADIARAEGLNPGVTQYYADFGVRP